VGGPGQAFQVSEGQFSEAGIVTLPEGLGRGGLAIPQVADTGSDRSLGRHGFFSIKPTDLVEILVVLYTELARVEMNFWVMIIGFLQNKTSFPKRVWKRIAQGGSFGAS
jgi:hypothetical protein